MAYILQAVIQLRRLGGDGPQHGLWIVAAGREDGGRVTHIGGDRLDEGCVHLLLYGGFRFAGDLRRDGVFLLVLVIEELRVFQRAAEKAQSVLRKVLRDDERRIIVAGPNALQRLIGSVREDPADGIVRLQRFEDLVAHVDLQAEDLGALIAVDHGHADPASGCALIGRPVGENVEPRIEARDDAQSHQRHDGDDAGCHPLQILAHDFDDRSHASASLSSGFGAASSRRAAMRLWIGRSSSGTSSSKPSSSVDTPCMARITL